jgi:hypothetical protein
VNEYMPVWTGVVRTYTPVWTGVVWIYMGIGGDYDSSDEEERSVFASLVKFYSNSQPAQHSRPPSPP